MKIPEPNSRPSNVPRSAVWASGKEWGYYFDCATDETAQDTFCLLYHNDGEIAVSGHYTVRNERRLATNAEFSEYHFYDGEDIFIESEKLDARKGNEGCSVTQRSWSHQRCLTPLLLIRHARTLGVLPGACGSRPPNTPRSARTFHNRRVAVLRIPVLFTASVLRSRATLPNKRIRNF